MTTMMTCPDFSVLSQFLDHELGSEEARRIERHLATCSACCKQIERVEQAESQVRTRWIQALARPGARASLPECLSPEMVSAYIQRTLSLDEGKRVEQHLHTCDHCLNEVLEATRFTVALATRPRVSVPADLKARVSSMWQAGPAKSQVAAFSRLVIKVAQKGLELLEQNLVAPLLDVQQMLAPVPAYRAEENPSVLALKIDAGQTNIEVVAVQEGEGAALKLTFSDASGGILDGRRVFIRRQGRAVFSAKTTEEGVLRTPHLEAGLYEVSCPDTSTGFEVDLRR